MAGIMCEYVQSLKDQEIEYIAHHCQKGRNDAILRKPGVQFTAIGIGAPITNYGGGEAGLTKNLFYILKSTPAYRILHHTLLKHREMVISIS
jgi:hypothetical protein